MATTHWNEEQEQLAIQWGERAAGYMWLHNEASNDYSRKRQYIGIPTIVVSSLASAGNVSTINSKPPLALQIVNGVTSFATVLLATLNNFLKYAELAESHRNMSKEFSTYTRAIATQLSFPTADRDHPKDFLNKYQQIFDDLIAKAPHIPDNVITKFSQTFQDDSIAKPLIVNALAPIVAYESTSNRHHHHHHNSPDTSNQSSQSPMSVFRRTARKVRTINELSRRLSQDLSVLEGTLGTPIDITETVDIPLDTVVINVDQDSAGSVSSSSSESYSEHVKT